MLKRKKQKKPQYSSLEAELATPLSAEWKEQGREAMLEYKGNV